MNLPIKRRYGFFDKIPAWMSAVLLRRAANGFPLASLLRSNPSGSQAAQVVSRETGSTVCLLLGIFLLALALRLFNLDASSLWIDEMYSFMVANTHLPPLFLTVSEKAIQPAGEFYRQYLLWQPLQLSALLAMLKVNVHMPLYYLLLNPWLQWFGNDAVGLRSFSALVSALTVLPVYGLGKAFGGKRAGLLSALVVALLPFQVYYGQEGRMYALSLFLAACSALAFWQTLHGRQAAGWWSVFYAVCIALGTLSHYMFAFFLGAQACYALLWLLRYRDWKRFSMLGLAGVALLLVVAFWMPIYQLQQNGVNEAYHFAKGLVGYPRYLTALIWQPLVVVAGDNRLERIFYIPFCLSMVLSHVRFTRIRLAETGSGFLFQRDIFLTIWIFAPLLLQIAYDFWKGTHTSVIDRYAMLIAPAMALLIGLGLSRCKAHFQTVLLSVMLLLAIATVWQPSPFRDEHNKDKDIRGKFSMMAQQAKPDDLVLANGPWGAALISAYYLNQFRPEQPILYWINRHGNQSVPLPASTVFKPYGRVWLFRYRANNERGLQAIKDRLKASYPKLERRVDWFLYSR